MGEVQEPTGDQCSRNETWELPDGRKAMACWYPQMGGYGGKCVVAWFPSLDGEGCFEAYVWHDGEFPFSQSGKGPTVLHHCDAEQFTRFGLLVMKAQGQPDILAELDLPEQERSEPTATADPEQLHAQPSVKMGSE